MNINLLRKREGYQEYKTPIWQHIGVAISGTAVVAAIAGYGALMLGRSVPTAIGLGATGSIALVINTKLKD